MEKYISQILNTIKEKEGLEVYSTSIPPKSDMGDIAIPCFTLAKELRKNPKLIAEQLDKSIKHIEFISRTEFIGGYLNIFIKKDILAQDTIKDVLAQKNNYGSSLDGLNKKIFIEHTSINPNASPHIGRARNAIIGDSIVRLLKFEGYDVDVHYFVNDIGKQISMLLVATEEMETITFENLLSIYVDINKRVEENKDLEKKVFDLLYKLEDGDQEVIKKFRNIVDICIKGQTGIFKEIGIDYDFFDYESDYVLGDKLKSLLEEIKETGKLFEDEENRYVMDFQDENMPYLVLTRGDKTSLYPLRDIAYTIDKIKTNSDRNLIVLGEDQKVYFKQIKKIVELLGYKAPEPIHYSFVLLKEGKMSTRKGTVVLLEDFMRDATAKAKEEIEKRNRIYKKETAQAIAHGALKFTILKASNDKNVIFDWEAALSFEGDSAPYIQYNYARICSIFKNYSKKLSTDVNSKLLIQKEEFEVLKQIASFPGVVNKTTKDLTPHLIANYLYDLTKKFSKFYNEHSVLKAETEELKEARLVLINCVKTVLSNGLNLLGIETVDEM